MASDTRDQPVPSPPSGPTGRLDSWKEIAAYLRRAVSTVQRWEREEGLPVHRLPHSKLGSVYALRTEIDRWWEQRGQKLTVSETGVPEEQEGDGAETAGSSATADVEVAVVKPAQHTGRPRFSLAAAGLLLGLAAVLAAIPSLRARVFSYFAPRKEIHSIAVLPLTNLSRDPEQEYFADGMTEELITELARIKALKVISHTSVMQYKGVRKPLPQIARELNVDGVVEGTVLRENGQVRITVQLLHGASDTHLWTEEYTRDLHSVLSLQGDVARSIAQAIRVVVTPEETQRLAERRNVDPEVYELTLKAQYLLGRENTNRDSLDKGVTLLRQALERDPSYAPAYVALANFYVAIAGVGYQPMHEACPDFRAASEKAIALDPTLGDAYAARAWTKLFCDWDWTGAEADAVRATQLSPGSATARNTHAWTLNTLGRQEEALKESRIAQQLDPLSVMITVHRAMFFYNARRYDESVLECRKALAFSPESVFAKWQLGATLTAMGKYDEAIQVFLSRQVPTRNTNWMLGYAYGRAGKQKEAQRILDFLLEKQKHQFIWPAIIAVVYIGLDDKDHAFEWLEKTYREREYWLQGLNVNPMFDPVRSDPRFQDLLRRMNFP
jgi:TolB-like protein/Tfp pilus assembly protein PilF